MHTFLTSHPHYKVDVRTIISVDSDCVEECVLGAHEPGTIQQIVEPSRSASRKRCHEQHKKEILS